MIQTSIELNLDAEFAARKVPSAPPIARDCGPVRSILDGMFSSNIQSRNAASDARFFTHLAYCGRCRNSFYARFKVRTVMRDRYFNRMKPTLF